MFLYIPNRQLDSSDSIQKHSQHHDEAMLTVDEFFWAQGRNSDEKQNKKTIVFPITLTHVSTNICKHLE